jgi:asparagine synthase (glutamine-hydrolysing)
MEACLAIPTWRWCAGGINRAPARSAFRDALPPLIIDRTTKTGPGSFMADVFEKNRAEIRERLYDGALASHHLLDVPELECLFSRRAVLRGEGFRRAMTLVDVEAWLQSWD